MLLSVRTLVRWRVAAGRQFSPSQPLLRGPASPLLLQHASLSLSASTENSSGGRVAAAADATAGTSSSTTSTSEPPEWLQAAGSQRDSHRADVHVVLVNPKIPQNTGNVARSCAATGVGLHLVGPLGFALDERKLKRAGLDYWGAVCVKVSGPYMESKVGKGEWWAKSAVWGGGIVHRRLLRSAWRAPTNWLAGLHREGGGKDIILWLTWHNCCDVGHHSRLPFQQAVPMPSLPTPPIAPT